MTQVILYGKPGCISNKRQIALLREAGHEVDVRNLLEENWTEGRLAAWFLGLPVLAWFNPTAPAIKQGLVDPTALSEEAALTAMVKDPVLIRRPLIRVNEQRVVGFEPATINALLGPVMADPQVDVESCPKEPAA